MSFFENVSYAERQGRERARQGFTRARASLEEAQSQLRRRMRIHPRSGKDALSRISLQEKENSTKARLPIVTINGEDLPPETETGKVREQVV